MDAVTAQIEAGLGIFFAHDAQKVLVLHVLCFDSINAFEVIESVINNGIGNIVHDNGVGKAHFQVAALNHLAQFIIISHRVVAVDVYGEVAMALQIIFQGKATNLLGSAFGTAVADVDGVALTGGSGGGASGGGWLRYRKRQGSCL